MAPGGVRRGGRRPPRDAGRVGDHRGHEEAQQPAVHPPPETEDDGAGVREGEGGPREVQQEPLRHPSSMRLPPARTSTSSWSGEGVMYVKKSLKK